MRYSLFRMGTGIGDLLLEDHLLLWVIDHLVRLQLEAVV